MKRTMHKAVLASVAAGILVLSAAANAQRGRRDAGAPTPPAPSADAGANLQMTVRIHMTEANHMLQRQRVYLFNAPAGTTAFRTNTLGDGTKLWALLPACREPHPDDPRDRCPVYRVEVETIAGTGTVQGTDPLPATEDPDSARVQAFAIPPGVTAVRLRLMRRNNQMRWETGVEVSEFHELTPPEGTAGGPRGFEFDFTRYLVR